MVDVSIDELTREDFGSRKKDVRRLPVWPGEDSGISGLTHCQPICEAGQEIKREGWSKETVNPEGPSTIVH